MRRNPVIADLFHRMKYMERRGSGLRKIVSETEKLLPIAVFLKCYAKIAKFSELRAMIA